jgi:hypothetical protein
MLETWEMNGVVLVLMRWPFYAMDLGIDGHIFHNILKSLFYIKYISYSMYGVKTIIMPYYESYYKVICTTKSQCYVKEWKRLKNRRQHSMQRFEDIVRS